MLHRLQTCSSVVVEDGVEIDAGSDIMATDPRIAVGVNGDCQQEQGLQVSNARDCCINQVYETFEDIVWPQMELR